MVRTRPTRPPRSRQNEFGLLPFGELPEGLVPIGDTGFFITPDTPADPTDCERWSDSPFCGGNPFAQTFIGIELEIIIDPCNVGITLRPIFGFIRLPPVTIIWRNPLCREPESPLPIDDLPTREGHYANATHYLGSLGKKVRRIVSIERIGTFSLTRRPFINSSFAGIGEVDRVNAWKIFYLDCNGNLFQWFNYDDSDSAFYDYDNDPAWSRPLTQDQYDFKQGAHNRKIFGVRAYPSGEVVNVGKVLFTTVNFPAYAEASPPFRCPNEVFPPPPPEEICCMPQCCPPQNDALLRLILQKVQKLSDIVGVNEYPAELPDSLITKIQVNNDELGTTIEPSVVKIPSLTKLASWLIERIDELFGQWAIPIEIKDSDATTPGDQPKGVVLPNLAEYAGETFLMQYSMLVNMEALISMCTRSLIEAGQIKQQGYVAYQLIQAISDYLGFKIVDRKTSIPLTFTPGKEDLGELLKSSNVNVVVPEFGDKVGLPVDLHRIRKACGIVEAQGWRNIDLNNPDLLGQVMGGIYKSRQMLADMLEKDEDSWDNFKEQTERGYSGEALHPTPNMPYGKPQDQRPKIKELGTTAASEAIENLPTGDS